MALKSKKVLMMRHAKSSWNNPGVKDFDRPLNKRGKKDAPKMGRYLKELGLFPVQIFSSPAARAKATILSVTEQLEIPESSITWNEDLYFKGTNAYLEAIRKADDQADIIMTVGHNPMTEGAVSLLSGSSSNKAIKTASIACFEFEADSWKDIVFEKKALKWVAGPKDLK